MKRYRLDRDAAIDLKAIHKHIASDNPSAANRFIAELKQKFHLIGSQPLIGQARNDLSAALRSFSVGNYVILYRPTPRGIEVARVLHAARDIGGQF